MKKKTCVLITGVTLENKQIKTLMEFKAKSYEEAGRQLDKIETKDIVFLGCPYIEQ